MSPVDSLRDARQAPLFLCSAVSGFFMEILTNKVKLIGEISANPLKNCQNQQIVTRSTPMASNGSMGPLVADSDVNVFDLCS